MDNKANSLPSINNDVLLDDEDYRVTIEPRVLPDEFGHSSVDDLTPLLAPVRTAKRKPLSEASLLYTGFKYNNFLMQLPREVLERTMHILPVKDVGAILQVCKNLNGLGDDPMFWASMAIERYNTVFKEVNKSAKDIFKQEHSNHLDRVNPARIKKRKQQKLNKLIDTSMLQAKFVYYFCSHPFYEIIYVCCVLTFFPLLLLYVDNFLPRALHLHHIFIIYVIGYLQACWMLLTGVVLCLLPQHFVAMDMYRLPETISREAVRLFTEDEFKGTFWKFLLLLGGSLMVYATPGLIMIRYAFGVFIPWTYIVLPASIVIAGFFIILTIALLNDGEFSILNGISFLIPGLSFLCFLLGTTLLVDNFVKINYFWNLGFLWICFCIVLTWPGTLSKNGFSGATKDDYFFALMGGIPPILCGILLALKITGYIPYWSIALLPGYIQLVVCMCFWLRFLYDATKSKTSWNVTQRDYYYSIPSSLRSEYFDDKDENDLVI